MFLADRYIKGECPNCGAKDQYGDACENCSTVYSATELKNPYSALSGAKPVLKTSQHHFFKLSDPKCKAFLRRWLETPGRLQPQVVNKAKEWLDGTGEKALCRLGHLARPALLRHPHPGPRGGEVPLRVARRADRLSRQLQELLRRRRGSTSRSFLQDPKAEQIHFIGKDIIYFHTLFWPAMLEFAGKPYKVPDHVYVHGFITVSGDKMSKSRGTGIDPLRYLRLGMNPEWLRYYIAAKLNANVEDLDFNPDDFLTRVNSDLVGKYVNIASRGARASSRNSSAASFLASNDGNPCAWPSAGARSPRPTKRANSAR